MLSIICLIVAIALVVWGANEQSKQYFRDQYWNDYNP
jgi:hypothetical protein